MTVATPGAVPSEAEALLLARRRLGLSQREMAERLEVTMHVYRGLEKNGGATLRQLGLASLGSLLEHERLLLRRLRSGRRALDVAAEMGVSAYWLSQMEKGKASTSSLAEYWAAQDQPWRN